MSKVRTESSGEDALVIVDTPKVVSRHLLSLIYSTNRLLVLMTCWYHLIYGTNGLLVPRTYWYHLIYGTIQFLVPTICWYQYVISANKLLVQVVGPSESRWSYTKH